MAPSTKLEDKPEGIENFQAWKYMIGIILREDDLEKYIKGEVAKPEEDEAKEKHKKYLIRKMRIIVDSIKDHLIPRVSSKRPRRRCMVPYFQCMKEGTSIKR